MTSPEPPTTSSGQIGRQPSNKPDKSARRATVSSERLKLVNKWNIPPPISGKVLIMHDTYEYVAIYPYTIRQVKSPYNA